MSHFAIPLQSSGFVFVSSHQLHSIEHSTLFNSLFCCFFRGFKWVQIIENSIDIDQIKSLKFTDFFSGCSKKVELKKKFQSSFWIQNGRKSRQVSRIEFHIRNVWSSWRKRTSVKLMFQIQQILIFSWSFSEEFKIKNIKI